MNKRSAAAAAVALLLASPLVLAANPVNRNALAAIDLNRTAIVSDIVASFATEMAQAHPGAVVQSTEMLRAKLSGLRADQLLAASLASSYATLQGILADADRAALRPVAKALGDPDADLSYTPLAPCRLIDTRGFGAPIQGGAFAPNERRSYDPQGECAVPATGVASLMVSFTTQNLTPASGGYLAIIAPAAPVTASVDIFNLNSEWSASNTVVATGGAGQFDVFVNTANAHVVVDVLGYFRAPSGLPAGGITAVNAGTGLTGGGASGDVSLAIDAGYQLPQACAANQVPKWNGAAWACAVDVDSDSNTTYTAGAGLGLVGTEFSLTPTQLLPQLACAINDRPSWDGNAWACSSDAFRQGGNAFATTAILGTTDLQAIEFIGNGTRMLRLEPSLDLTVNTLGGSPANSGAPGVTGGTNGGGGAPAAPNTVTGNFGTISGGNNNTASASASVGGGEANAATGVYAAIAGGAGNSALDGAVVGGGVGNQAGVASVVGGGNTNTANAILATIAGGQANVASNAGAFVGGGSTNQASGIQAAISGGANNTASGNQSAIPGGDLNIASGITSFAAGHRAQATFDGCFVWGDSSAADVACGGVNEFVARATGGASFLTSADGSTGVNLPAGGGAWSTLSDRAAKKDLMPVDARSVLARVAAMPLYTWRYIREASGARHLGPVAQDFRTAFGLGDSDRNISTVDADGVALAAIQGLNLELQEKLAAQKARIDELEGALAAIRARLGIR